MCLQMVHSQPRAFEHRFDTRRCVAISIVGVGVVGHEKGRGHEQNAVWREELHEGTEGDVGLLNVLQDLCTTPRTQAVHAPCW